MRATISILLVFLMVLIVSKAEAAWTYHNPTVISVYDGDTFRASFEVWPDHYAVSSVRVMGIDAPEMRGKCKKEKAQAIKAKVFAKELLEQVVTVKVIKSDKYGGRVDAVVYINGKDMAAIMVEAGLGRVYAGGKRKGWCKDEE